jgi:PAS domain S-box-containing protein
MKNHRTVNRFLLSKTNGVLLQTIFQHIPQFIFWKDINSVYLGCNEKYAELIGLNSSSEIIGKTDADIGWLSDGDTAEQFQQGDRSTLEGKYTINEEEWLSLPSGIKILTLINKVPLVEKGKIVGVLGVATDITEKMRIEENFQRIEHQLKGMIMVTATIAHEIRTPLAAIKAAARGVKLVVPFLIAAYKNAIKKKIQEETVSENQIKLLEEATDSVEKKVDQSNMVIDMLLSNIQNRGVEITEFEICSARDCIQKAISQYAFVSSQPEIDLKDNKDFAFYGKEVLILHVLFNLFKNALYFIQKARKGKIIIWVELGKKVNELHFKDTAMGISEEHLPVIFDDFFTYGTNKGTGIGLSFCKKTMQAIGGDITCKSVYGEYTEFVMSFPLLIKQIDSINNS